MGSVALASFPQAADGAKKCSCGRAFASKTKLNRHQRQTRCVHFSDIHPKGEATGATEPEATQCTPVDKRVQEDADRIANEFLYERVQEDADRIANEFLFECSELRLEHHMSGAPHRHLLPQPEPPPA